MSLSGNNLNRFDESVFKFMLQDMVNANGGFVDLDSSRFLYQVLLIFIIFTSHSK